MRLNRERRNNNATRRLLIFAVRVNGNYKSYTFDNNYHKPSRIFTMGNGVRSSSDMSTVF